MLLNDAPEFGTVCGTQMPVYKSSSSPEGTLGQRHRGTGNGDDRDRRSCGHRDRESAGKDQSSY